MPDYYALGAHTWAVTTTSPDAQTWFDRGLVWTYAFNHEEAIRCYEQAVVHDPTCAMAHWGIAYAAGPNYNKPWEAFDEVDLAASLARARQATADAMAHRTAATPLERALIDALPVGTPPTS